MSKAYNYYDKKGFNNASTSHNMKDCKTTRPDNIQLPTIIARLKGSTDTIADHLPAGMLETDLTQADKLTIESEIMQCGNCGNWFDPNDFGCSCDDYLYEDEYTGEFD